MPQTEAPPDAPHGPEVDLDLARQLFEGDEATLHLAATLFLDEARDQLTAVGDALRAGDARKVHETAHRLKGAVAMFGARRVTELADRIQLAGAHGELASAGTLLRELEVRLPCVIAALEELVRSSAPDRAATLREHSAGGRR